MDGIGGGHTVRCAVLRAYPLLKGLQAKLRVANRIVASVEVVVVGFGVALLAGEFVVPIADHSR